MNRSSVLRVSSQILIAVLCFGALSNALYSTEQYLSDFVKQSVGWTAFILLFLTYKLGKKLDSYESFPRIAMILLSAFLSVRYITWRTFDTLYFTGPLDFIALSALYLAECHAISLHLFSLVINMWPLRRKVTPVPLDSKELPTVDIFIPTYSEPEDIVKVTATAAKHIKYPADKLRVHILDDGGTQARRRNPKLSQQAWERHYKLRALASELGVNYITRESNKHAKAGNINHALRVTDGDIVLVLDCDHVPTRDILEQTVGMFLKDEKLFLVQTPHFFINPTPVEKHLEGVGSISVENDMFFRLIHLGLDFWNSSYFCGSAALLRRKYLMLTGGISTDTITEDAETALLLHDKGLNSVFIDRPMVCGLSPETFSDYVTQRTRWAQGMIQLLIVHNPLLFKGLGFFQRLSYFNSSFFWFFSFSRFIFFVAPAMYLIFGLKIYHASLEQIIAYAVPYILSTMFTMDYLYGKVRKPFFSEIYESVQALFLMPALISVMLNPLKPTFKITQKGVMTDKETLNPLAVPFFIVVGVNFISLPVAAYSWIEYPLFRDVVLVTTAWCLFNIFLAIISLGAFWEKKQVRRHHRIKVSGQMSVYFPRLKQTVEGQIKDMSLMGVSVEVEAPFEIKSNEDVEFTASDSYGDKYKFRAKIRRAIKRKKKVVCGTEFYTDGDQFTQAVIYVYGDSQRWVDSWNEKARPISSRKLLWGFFALGLKGEKEIILSLLNWIKIRAVNQWRKAVDQWRAEGFLNGGRMVPEAVKTNTSASYKVVVQNSTVDLGLENSPDNMPPQKVTDGRNGGIVYC